MEINRVRIQNFKSIIDSDWIDIEDTTTTLIGKNESGKTSLLEGIAYFQQSEYCSDQDINSEKEPDLPENGSFPISSIELKIDDDDAEGYHQLAAETTGDDDIVVFTRYANGRKIVTDEINLGSTDWERGSRINSQKKHVRAVCQQFLEKTEHESESEQYLPEISDIEVDDLQEFIERLRISMNELRNESPQDSDSEKELIEETVETIREIRRDLQSTKGETVDVFESIPEIEYHSSVPQIQDEIEIEKLQSGESILGQLLESRGINLDQEQGGLIRDLRDVARDLQELVSDRWKQKSVNIELTPGTGNKITVLVQDTSILQDTLDNGNAQEQVRRSDMSPSQRSQGFRWFLSFCCQFLAIEQNTNSGRLVLLDDPAVYLHPEGKQDCLDAIRRLPEDTQVVYSTHSPFLIGKRYPEQIRIVEDRGDGIGTEITTNFTEAPGIALEPVRSALGIGLGDLPFVSDRMVLLEGISDYLIITALGHYFKDYGEGPILDIDEVAVTPFDGADEATTAGKWVSSQRFEYAIILDNDQKGRDVKEEIEIHHPEINANNVLLLEEYNDINSGKFEIEDMFRPGFYIDCVNEVITSELDDSYAIEYDIEDREGQIGEQEYEGDHIAPKIDAALKANGVDSGLRKRAAAKNIKKRIDESRNINEKDVEMFKPLLGNVNRITSY